MAPSASSASTGWPPDRARGAASDAGSLGLAQSQLGAVPDCLSVEGAACRGGEQAVELDEVRREPGGARRATLTHQLGRGPQPQPRGDHGFPVDDGEATFDGNAAHDVCDRLDGLLPVLGRDGRRRTCPSLSGEELARDQVGRQPRDLVEVALGRVDVSSQPVQPGTGQERPGERPAGLRLAKTASSRRARASDQYPSSIRGNAAYISEQREVSSQPPVTKHPSPLPCDRGGRLEIAEAEKQVRVVVPQPRDVLVVAGAFG